MRAGLDRRELGTQIALELASGFLESGLIAAPPSALDAREQVRPLPSVRGHTTGSIFTGFDGDDLGRGRR